MRELKQLLFFVCICALASLVFAFKDLLDDVLIYQGLKVKEGELWRLVTCHLVHSNVNHLLVNLIAIGAVAIFCSKLMSTWAWCAATLFTGISVALAYYAFHSLTTEYFGLSAIGYSLGVLGAILHTPNHGPIALLIALVIAAKAFSQLFFGASEDTLLAIEANVAVHSHVYGVVVGALVGISRLIYEKNKKES